MFIFSCFIFCYFTYLGYKYIPSCCQRLKDEIAYGFFSSWKYKYENYVNRFELSKTGLKHIKDALLKSTKNGNNWFSVSDSISMLSIEDCNATIISDLLVEYKNVREWGPTDIGDVLYILNLTPFKITRSYMRTVRCFHILLDEFIYYIYKNLSNDILKNKFGNSHVYLKMLICYYGLSEGENTYIQQKNLEEED
jgi:hypothetical protein